MFWIGLIVGMVIAFAVVFGCFVWACKSAGASYDDLVELGSAGMQAFNNRESKLQVWHEDECLFETVFEEN